MQYKIHRARAITRPADHLIKVLSFEWGILGFHSCFQACLCILN